MQKKKSSHADAFTSFAVFLVRLKVQRGEFMRLKSMTVKNFKGIDEHGITIDFAPITMLFGPNNAGKSTILQAMLLARQILCHNSADTNTVHGGGDSISLGSFADYVHKHEENRAITIRFDMEDFELPTYIDEYEKGWSHETWREAEEILNSVSRVAVTIIIRKFGFFAYQIKINGKNFTSLLINNREKSAHFRGCNPLVFINKKTKEKIDNAFAKAEKNFEKTSDANKLLDALDLLLDSMPELLKPVMGVNRYLEDSYHIPTSDYYWCVPELATENGRIALPFYGKLPFNFEHELPFPVDSLTIDEEKTHIVTSKLFEITRIRPQLLSSLILGPGKLLKEELEKILYIGPLRKMPPRNFIPKKVENVEGWAEGYAAWDKIATGDEEEIEKINSWLHGEGSLSIGYKIVRKEILEIEEQNPLISALGELLVNDFDDEKIPLLRKFIEESPRKTKWSLVNVNNDVEVHPCDMGTGISQVMPVIVASALAKSGDIISMEQPELHIHPRWQVALGDLFIKVVNAHETPPLFLIETHSEHLVLRFKRRMRDTYKNIAHEGLELTPDDISIFWIGQYNGRTDAMFIELDENGSFNTPWPEGFFEERGEELVG